MNTLRKALHRYWNSALNPDQGGRVVCPLGCDRSATHPTTVRAGFDRAGPPFP
jgi:hypothetical protein